MPTIDKIDSNATSLAFAEEECLKILPGVDGADAVWYGLEPNSYSDFGGEVTKVARSPISISRQNRKGVTTDLTVSGGFNADFTKSNMNRLLQGFFFADAREKPSTISLLAADVPITGVVDSTKTYTAAAGLDDFAKAGYIVNAKGFAFTANNGLKTVASATATTIVVDQAVVDETPPSTASVEVVGFEFPTSDLDFAVTGAIPSIVSASIDLTTLGLIPGEWVFIGGDATLNTFVNNVGYARIYSISTASIVFDDVSFAPVTEAGTALVIRIFFGTVIKNENTAALIKRRSYSVERQLGLGATDIQAEYLEGAVANEFTLNIPQADKLNCDLSFIACDNSFRSGEVDDEIKAGTRVAVPGEDAFNTSSDVYRLKMAILDPLTATPTALFGYVSEATLSVSNGVTPDKAVGVLGAFETSTANFTISGSLTVYFTNVAAVQAVRANSDVGLSFISASQNCGFVYDIPLLDLGGGRIGVEKDAPITVPLTPSGAQNANGYTMLYNSFSYLPDVAMPA